MNSNCQNCRESFTITPDDLAFYQKMQVPPPTWCVECRERRRISFRNERLLYRRKCDLCQKDMISVYSPDKDLKVYCIPCYQSDKWDAHSYGRDYDFSKPFFTQLKELQRQVPRVSLIQINALNSDWINYERGAKNSYLDVGGENTEDCAYATYALDSRAIFDSYWIAKSDSLYDTMKSGTCFQTFYSFWCFKCTDTWCSYDCADCTNIIGCIGLRHKEYHIFNQPVSKAEYEKFVAENLNGSYANLQKLQKQAQEFHLKFPRRFSFINKSENSSGNFIESSKNAINAWHVSNVEDSKNIYIAANIKHSRDISPAINDEYVYEVISCAEGNNVKFCFVTWDGVYNLDYCDYIFVGHDCFGCIGLKKGEFSILNKKYSENKYDELRAKVIKHMNDMPYVDQQGRQFRYGEYFPPMMTPFCYNETVAQEYYPLSSEHAIKLGYQWKETDRKNIKPTTTAGQLADNIHDTPADMLSQVIECEHKGQCHEACNYAYKLIAPELAFYKKHNLPLPRFCPNCRHYQRIKKLGPRRLTARQCDCGGEQARNQYTNKSQHGHGASACPEKFETSYFTGSPEIVYCEKCYQSEIA